LNPADPDAPEQEVAPVEEEEKVKTLEEYLAEKANKSLKVSLPEARKANDADESVFKGTVAFAKKDFEEFYISKETKTTKKTTEKVRKEKVFVEIEQRFQEKARPEFRKSNDRRGGRPNNKNNRRAAKSNVPAVNLQDASAFPTLGATA
jgi:plasminogen activator inhibitor 1 RNA-binding protein